MKILAMETSTEVGSIAVVHDGQLMGEISVRLPMKLLTWLVPAIQSMMDTLSLTMRDLDAIAVGVGPGSFTGVRLAMATAKSIAQVASLPLQGIPSLDAMAHQVALHLPPSSGHSSAPVVCPILNARKGQIYTALYALQASELSRISDYLAIPTGDLPSLLQGKGSAILIGDDFPGLEEVQRAIAIPASWIPSSSPCARHVAALALRYFSQGTSPYPGRATDPALLSPLYVTAPEAKKYAAS